MYADNTLTPKEAVRLCVLGTLAAGGARYSEVAVNVREFMGQVAAPSLDVMAPAIQLLTFEGLISPIDGQGMEDNATLEITDAGHTELTALLTANIRANSGDLSKLIVALKFRFLHLLPQDEQIRQIDLIREATDIELGRLEHLMDRTEGTDGYFSEWLVHETDALKSRIAWLDNLEATL